MLIVCEIVCNFLMYFYADNKLKVADGFVIYSTGCGVNVANKDPTMCINDILSRVTSITKPECFTVEEFIARALNALEMLIAEFQTWGRDSFLDKYCHCQLL